MSAAESELVRRIRYVTVRRPVTRAAVAAVMLVPALGRDPLLDVDRPVVLALGLGVTASLTFVWWRMRRELAGAPVATPQLARAMVVPVAVSMVALVVLVLAATARLHGAASVGVVLQLIAVAEAARIVVQLKPRRDDDQAPPPQPSGFDTAMQGAPAFEGVSIACSGGGIRAAAFCLGGLQRLRHREGEGAPSLYDRAERVYAVSGGSYIATALHMARRHSPPADDVQASLFAPGSPEEDWLRRKSKFLLPTGSTLVTGFLSLVYGIAVNLTLIGVALYVAALYTGWVHNRLDVVCPGGPTGGAASCLGDGSKAVFATSDGSHFLVGWAVLLAGLVLFVGSKTVAKYSGRGRLVFAGTTRALVTSGVAVGALLVVLPWLLVTLNNATITNKPTATVARVMAAARLATPDGCVRAIERDLTASAVLAWERAPSSAQEKSVPFTYRGCGGTWTDDAVVFAPGGQVAARPSGSWCYASRGLPRPTFCDERPGTGHISFSDTLASWLAGILALAAAVRGVLAGRTASIVPGTRRGMISDVVRRVLLPWAAGAVVVVAVLVVLMVLLRDNLLYPARLHTVHAGMLAALAALALRVLTDAMLSSLHPFYRERLSDSFLVVRNGTEAEPLPYRLPTHVHENGSLTGPDLVVCCAANIQDRDYVPAARGCAPFQFRTDTVVEDGVEVHGRIGISDSRLPLGRMQPAVPYSATSDPQGLDTTLAAAMAASGAAFSPRVGRMDSRVRPYRMLLALANARLGVWLPNPYLVDGSAQLAASPSSVRQGLGWALRRAMRPGPFRIFKEAFGSLSVDDTRIYVTDGGHYDNTALVEALRDRPRTLFVLDASADLEDSLDALGDAIVTARMDLGLVLRPAAGSPVSQVRRDAEHPVTVIPRGATSAVQQPALPARGWLHLEVFTVDDPHRVVGDVWFVKNVRTGEPNIEIDSYAAENRSFPITSTGNQFYGEYDFEAYRLLGYLNTTTMLAARAELVGPDDVPGAGAPPPGDEPPEDPGDGSTYAEPMPTPAV
ncbi:hypothetical protein GCM10027446_09530 [Angustibacter peucedani]